MTDKKPRARLLDCEAGRALGCRTFCCRLIVRLSPEERARGVPGVVPPMGCVPKDSDGYCMHLDRETNRCRIWDQRPDVCRRYDCNGDTLLQVAVRTGPISLRALVSENPEADEDARVVVPPLDESG